MNKKKIVNIVFVGYLIAYFLSKIYPEIRIHFSFFLGLVMLVIMLKYFSKRYFKIISIVYFFAIFSFLNNLLKYNYNDVSYSILMLTFPGFIIAIDKKYINAKSILFIYYLFSIYIIYHEFILNTDFNMLIDGGSRNYIGWLSLIICILYYFISVNNISKISLIPSAINLLIAFIMQGRAGIIISLLLFVAVIYDLYLFRLNIKKIISFSIIILILFIAFYNLKYFFSEKLMYFEERGLDLMGRDMIWQYYLDVIKNDNLKLFFGVSRFELYEFAYFNNNLHNSLISGHSNFGIFFILFIFYALLLIIKNIRRHFLISIMLMLLIVRSFTDSLLFIQNLDFLVYSIINFLYIHNYKRELELTTSK